MSLDSWSRNHRRDPEVAAWLRENPVPEDWVGTRLSWAYNSMPDRGKVWSGVGVLAGLALVWWAWRQG